jgi:RHS repeat-associated protein
MMQNARGLFNPFHFFSIVFSVGLAGAQPNPPATNPLDGVTPHALKAGEPSSTYTLSNIDQINYYNGTVSASLPILHISGRGEVSHTVAVGIQPPVWSVTSSFSQTDHQYTSFHTRASIDGYHPFQVGYGPGILMIKRSVAGIENCQGSYRYNSVFTHLVYAVSGGAEYELYDTSSAGVFIDDGACGRTPPYRGPVFTDRNGMGMIFVAKAPVPDDVTIPEGDSNATNVNTSISGTLYFRDGSQSVIDNGRTTQKIDRHGNTISFCYKPCTVNGSQKTSGNTVDVDIITDAIGREYHFEYGISDGNYGTVDRIRYQTSATNSVEHIIRISYTTPSLNSNLFSVVCCEGTGVPQLPANVWLQNAASGSPSYQFTYDAYGELTGVTLPTSAKITYSYASGVDCASITGCYANGQILDDASDLAFQSSAPDWTPILYRRVVTRNELADGVSVSRTTQISRPEKAISSSQRPVRVINTGGYVTKTTGVVIHSLPFVEVTDSGTGISPVTTRHYFFGYANFNTGTTFELSDYSNPQTWSNLIGPALELYAKMGQQGLTGYPDPYPSKEYRTEVPGIQLVDRAYGPSGTGIDVCQENTTLYGIAPDQNTPKPPDVTSAHIMLYDTNANRTDLYEYPYGGAPSIPSAPASAPLTSEYKIRSCPTSTSGFVRHTKTTYKTDSSYLNPPVHLPSLVTQAQVLNSADAVQSQTDFSYDQTAPSDPGLVQWTSPPVPGTLGNVTTVMQSTGDLSSNPTGATVSETRTYDTAGNITSVSDRRYLGQPAHNTTYDWSDNCSGAKPDGTLGAFLKRITFPAANSVQQTRSWQYDCYTGRPTSFTDRDGITLSFTYEQSQNLFDRLTDIQRTSDNSSKHFIYYDPPSTLAVESHSDVLLAAQSAKSGDLNYAKATYDGFGRATGTEAHGAGTSDVPRGATDLDALGRPWRQYLPYFNSKGAYRESAYDALGRVTTITNSADGSQIKSFYSANVTTTTDEAGKSVMRETDALGRLTKVTEDPSGLAYVTEYTYDTLDNLKQVQQKGRGTTAIVARTFEYDSLKRLRKATNPETGLITYEYDANGNLTRKTEADSTTTDLQYDALNRLASKTYGGTTTPSAIWCYDGTTYTTSSNQPQQCVGSAVAGSYGKLTGSGTTSSSMKYEFDSSGRISASEQRTPFDSQSPYRFTYTYYPNDALATETYPSQSAVTTCYDGLGRPAWVSKSGNSGNCTSGNPPSDAYASGFSYEAAGSIREMRRGPLEFEHNCYNSRQQIAGIRVGLATMTDCTPQSNDLLNLAYDYGTSLNNGDPLKQTIRRAAGFAAYQSYAYDGVSRLKAASEYSTNTVQPDLVCGDSSSIWCEAYDYGEADTNAGNGAAGNRKIGARRGRTASFLEPSAFDPSNNRMTTGAQGGVFGYDGRGNVNAEAGAASGANPAMYLYDAENRLLAYCAQGGTCTTATSGAVVFVYDADGRRVRKGTVTFVYDANGQLAAEYGNAGSAPGTIYLSTDALGSTRLVSDGSGNEIARRDYYPFGEEIMSTVGNGRACAVPSTCPTLSKYGADPAESLRFTGKERDAETGLDYFGARYFSGAQGRFTSPDPTFLVFNKLFNPQRWNLYSYALNNPFRYIDPDGRDALAVAFPKYRIGMKILGVPIRVPFLGHGGMVIINKDGTTRYMEYGRYDPQQKGLIRPFENGKKTPNVSFDASGHITEDSLQALMQSVSENAGQGGPVEGLLIETSDDEDLLMNAYLDDRDRQNSDENRPAYSTSNHNCGTLACETLGAAGRPSAVKNGWTPMQNLFGLWWQLGGTLYNYSPQTKKVKKEKVTSRIKFDIPEGGQ